MQNENIILTAEEKNKFLKILQTQCFPEVA